MSETSTSDTSNMKNGKKLLWIARILLLASAVSILIASCYFYNPRNFPFSGLSPQTGQTLLYGGLVLAIAGFAWRWPGAGGIIAVLYSVIKLIPRFSPEPLTLIPVPVYVLLYGLFLAGGVMHVVFGRAKENRKSASNPFAKRLIWIARVTALAPIFINAILYWLIYPLPFVLGSIPGLVTAGIAWFWPAPGGLLMLLLSIPGFFLLFESNWDFQQKLPVYIFCLTFIASGFLHLIIAWRGRRLHAG